MSIDRIDEQRIKQTMEFHGHWCPVKGPQYPFGQIGRLSDYGLQRHYRGAVKEKRSDERFYRDD